MPVTTTPTLSIKGTVTVNTPKASSEEVLAGAFEGISSYTTVVVEMEPGETNKTVTPPDSPSNYLRIDTNRKIRYQLNGGTENFVCSRLRLDAGTEISQIVFSNDQLDIPEKVSFTVSFSSGGEIV